MYSLREVMKEYQVNMAQLGIGCGIGLSVVVGYKIYMKYKWTEVGVLKTIYIHPLKSGRALEVESAECGIRGPQWNGNLDREFVLYRPLNPPVVYDIRSRSKKLILISMEAISEGKWRLSGNGGSTIEFNGPDESVNDGDITVKLWDVMIDGVDCGDEVATWISDFIGEEVRLMKHRRGLATNRIPRPKYTTLYPSTVDESCVPAFADVSPYMIINESSFKEVNEKLPFALPMRTYRPNFVVAGDDLEPWVEDEWTGQIRIGDVVFNYNKPCTRCNILKINTETGELYPNNEPLKTLKAFRQIDRKYTDVRKIVGDSPIVGMHYTVVKPATLRVGDRVWVRRTGPVNHLDHYNLLPLKSKLLIYLPFLNKIFKQ